jgi:hypothetical protein
LVGDDYVAAGDDLKGLLAELADEPDDVAIWREGCRLAAVIHRGVVQRFEAGAGTGRAKAADPPVGAEAGPRGGCRDLPFGRKPAALARWMGSRGFSPEQARQVLTALGVTMTPEAIGQELALGRAGRGRIPELSRDEARALRQALERAGGDLQRRPSRCPTGRERG